MDLTRLFEQEDNEIGDKLFRHARFKGGGGGGTQSTQTVQKADPWSGQQPFLTEGYEAAKTRFGSDQPQFFPGSTISPFNQNELTGQQAMPNWFDTPNLDMILTLYWVNYDATIGAPNPR